MNCSFVFRSSGANHSQVSRAGRYEVYVLWKLDADHQRQRVYTTPNTLQDTEHETHQAKNQRVRIIKSSLGDSLLDYVAPQDAV